MSIDYNLNYYYIKPVVNIQHKIGLNETVGKYIARTLLFLARV